MRRIIVGTVNLLLVLSLILSLSSCGSLDQSLSRITTVSSETTSEISTAETTKGESGAPELRDLVASYMDVLISGDLNAVCSKFGYKNYEVLYPSSNVDEVVFPILFQNSSYTVGVAMTVDYSRYDVDVILSFPDIAECFDQVLHDETFMIRDAKDWVLALKSHENVDAAKEQMVYLAFAEALVRIKEGTYQTKKKYTSTFTFHANPGEWVAEGYPDFVTILGKKSYLSKFAYVNVRKEYDLLAEYTTMFVNSGDITQEEANTILNEKMQEIAAMS